jgi:hypothetical protein
MNIAAPPTVGIGRVCTVRSLGGDNAPTLVATRRTSGVHANVTSDATAKTTT